MIWRARKNLTISEAHWGKIQRAYEDREELLRGLASFSYV
jgi:hypothetical protein